MWVGCCWLRKLLGCGESECECGCEWSVKRVGPVRSSSIARTNETGREVGGSAQILDWQESAESAIVGQIQIVGERSDEGTS